MFNFTLESVREPAGDWGVGSVYTPGEETGVLGEVIKGEKMQSDLSLSMWLWNSEREKVSLDFCMNGPLHRLNRAMAIKR